MCQKAKELLDELTAELPVSAGMYMRHGYRLGLLAAIEECETAAQGSNTSLEGHFMQVATRIRHRVRDTETLP